MPNRFYNKTASFSNVSNTNNIDSLNTELVNIQAGFASIDAMLALAQTSLAYGSIPWDVKIGDLVAGGSGVITEGALDNANYIYGDALNCANAGSTKLKHTVKLPTDMKLNGLVSIECTGYGANTAAGDVIIYCYWVRKRAGEVMAIGSETVLRPGCTVTPATANLIHAITIPLTTGTFQANDTLYLQLTRAPTTDDYEHDFTITDIRIKYERL